LPAASDADPQALRLQEGWQAQEEARLQAITDWFDEWDQEAEEAAIYTTNQAEEYQQAGPGGPRLANAASILLAGLAAANACQAPKKRGRPKGSKDKQPRKRKAKTGDVHIDTAIGSNSA